jgi:catechol 2,3-dioxygenase-like lactoylglutathione lyase family enzyme
MRAASLVAVFMLGVHAPAWAQLLSAKEGPIVYGHHHIYASDVGAHRQFWADALGGVPIKVANYPGEIFRFPNVFVYLSARTPSGGTKGTVVNHVGFETRDIRLAVDKLKAAGFRMVTREELPDSYTVTNDLGQRPGGNVVAFVMGPDDIKVELIENKAIAHPLVMHHVHFAAPDIPKMQAWYGDIFGAKPGTRAGFQAADLPGVNLTFSGTQEPVVPTRGRALDHIGFEVKNLEQFCKDLEAKGVKFDRPYTKMPQLGVAIAFLTDPWGTYIELTEGLAAIE